MAHWQQLRNDSTLTGLVGVEDMPERSHERVDGVHYCNYADWISHEVDEKTRALGPRGLGGFCARGDGGLSWAAVQSLWKLIAYACTGSFAWHAQPKQSTSFQWACEGCLITWIIKSVNNSLNRFLVSFLFNSFTLTMLCIRGKAWNISTFTVVFNLIPTVT